MGGMAGKLAMTLSMGLDVIGMGAFAGSGSAGLFLDSGVATAANGYSLRKLRSAYAGYAIKVRRSNDNATQDIGFVGSDLDTASLATFVGANSAYIDTWYDQVASANLTQATTTKQPRIVNAGVLDTKNSLPSMAFDFGRPDFLSTTASGLASQTQFTGSVVASTTAGSRILSYSEIGGSDYGAAGNVIIIYRDSDNVKTIRNGTDSTGQTTVSGQLFSAFTIYNATQGFTTLDGTAGTPISFAATALTSSTPRFTVGNNAGSHGGEGVSGTISEVILWASALSVGDRASLVADTRAYWGTP